MLKNVVVILAIAITFFACEGNYNKVQQLNLQDHLPVAEGFDINLVYTDSGKVVSTLDAARLLDYSNFEFSYQEFPDGVEVHFYEDDQESTITSKFAKRFPLTGLVDLRDSVVLTTADGNVLTAEQLYWNQESKWVFTDQPYRIRFNDGSYNDGEGFDANEDFTVFLSRRNDGIQIIDQTETNPPDEQ